MALSIDPRVVAITTDKTLSSTEQDDLLSRVITQGRAFKQQATPGRVWHFLCSDRAGCTSKAMHFSNGDGQSFHLDAIALSSTHAAHEILFTARIFMQETSAFSYLDLSGRVSQGNCLNFVKMREAARSIFKEIGIVPELQEIIYRYAGVTDQSIRGGLLRVITQASTRLKATGDVVMKPQSQAALPFTISSVFRHFYSRFDHELSLRPDAWKGVDETDAICQLRHAVDSPNRRCSEMCSDIQLSAASLLHFADRQTATVEELNDDVQAAADQDLLPLEETLVKTISDCDKIT